MGGKRDSGTGKRKRQSEQNPLKEEVAAILAKLERVSREIVDGPTAERPRAALQQAKDWQELQPKLTKANRFTDYRVMLEKQKNIDAVIISTPDHTHAHAAIMAMKLGKHVYVEKPLCYTVREARLMLAAAERSNVVTQMGNTGHSNDQARHMVEMLWAGAIGTVREAHVWTNRPIWPQGIPRPASKEVPKTLNWDL